MKRRDFLGSTLTLAGGLAVAPISYSSASARTASRKASDRILLRSTGIEVSRLAMGTGTHGVNRSSNPNP